MDKAERDLRREAKRYEKRMEKHLVDTVRFTTRYMKDAKDYESADNAKHAAFRLVSSMALHCKTLIKLRDAANGARVV